MAIKGSTRPLGATDQGLRPGGFPLGSALSRAAARSLLAARKVNEEAVDFQTVSILDGKPARFDGTGLAEALNAARRKLEAGRSPAPKNADESMAERREDCLSDRITKARQRLTDLRDLDSLL